MKILILSSEHFVFEDETHPSGIFQRDLAKAYKSLGHEVAVISFRFDPIRKKRPAESGVYAWNDIIVARGVKRKFFPERYLPFFILQKFYENGYLKLFRRIEKNFGSPDVIHAHNFEYAGYSSLKLASYTASKLLITEHSSRFFAGKNRVFNGPKYFISKHPRLKATAVSQSLKVAISQKLDLNTQVVPNPLDPMFLKEDKFNHARGHFLSVGSLRPIKNHELLILAFCRFRQINPLAKLTIVGSGELHKDLIALIQKNNAFRFIEIINPMSRSNLRKLYNQVDALLVSSNFETFGVVAIEAMSCGLPVLSTKNGGIESIITHEKLGRTCEKDVQSFYEMLKEFNSHDFDRALIRKHACSTYGAQKIASQYLKIALRGEML